MRRAIERLFKWAVRPGYHKEDDLADAKYIEMARNDSFRPLREVLADIEAEEHVELRRPIKQQG